jgi:hypothetical protein
MHKEPQVVGPYPNSPIALSVFSIRSSAGHAKLIFIHVKSPIAGQRDRRHYDSYSQGSAALAIVGGGRVVELQNAERRGFKTERTRDRSLRLPLV